MDLWTKRVLIIGATAYFILKFATIKIEITHRLDLGDILNQCPLLDETPEPAPKSSLYKSTLQGV